MNYREITVMAAGCNYFVASVTGFEPGCMNLVKKLLNGPPRPTRLSGATVSPRAAAQWLGEVSCLNERKKETARYKSQILPCEGCTRSDPMWALEG